jgi:hypothetical protein
MNFLDLDHDVVERERARVLSSSPPGSTVATALRRRPAPLDPRIGEAP